MKNSISLILIFFFIFNGAFSQKPMRFFVKDFKQIILTKSDLSFEILFENNGSKKMEFPKYPIISSFYQHDSDIGYQIYKLNSGQPTIDSCIMLVMPRIPEDGIANESIKIGQQRIYKERLSWPCFLDTGCYKVRFILKLNKYNKKVKPIYTRWYNFIVSNNLLPLDLQ